MNIFITNNDPIICAQDHCDVHLRKQILETAQMLSTAHIVLDGNQVAYKKTHQNHPCSVWVREASENYFWTVGLLESMLIEYEYRFQKHHKTSETVNALRSMPANIKQKSLTPFVTAMPDECKRSDPLESYHYYLKVKFNEWASREKPIKLEWTKRGSPAWI